MLHRDQDFGEMRKIRTKFWSENLKVGDSLEDLDVDVRIMLEWILEEKIMAMFAMNSYGQRSVAGCCECGNIHSGSIKGEKCVYLLSISFSRRTLLHRASQLVS
jgi:hypothetical protein